MRPGDTRLTVEVPIEFKRRVKMFAAQHGKDLRDVVMDAVEVAMAVTVPPRKKAPK